MERCFISQSLSYVVSKLNRNSLLLIRDVHALFYKRDAAKVGKLEHRDYILGVL